MATDSLGPFQREYSAAPQGRYEVISGCIILAVILGIGVVALAFSQPGQLWIGVLLIGTLAAALGFYIYSGARKLRRRIRFHAEGMVLHNAGAETVVRWVEVAALAGMLPVSFRGTPAHVGGPLAIELHDGRRFRLSHGYADPDVLANFIHEKVVAVLLPAAQAQLERGQPVSLGPLQVDRAGLHMGDQSLPWSELQGIAFTADDLTITRAGGPAWATLKIAQVPNANLLLHLIRAHRPA